MQQWFCVTNVAMVFCLRTLFNSQTPRQSFLWKKHYGQSQPRAQQISDTSNDEFLSRNQRRGYRGLDLQNTIDQWGVAYLPRNLVNYRVNNIPTFKRQIIHRLGFIKKSIVPFGLTLPNLETPTNMNNLRSIILRHVLMSAKDWNEYSLALVLAAQLCVQAYIRQVFFQLYKRSQSSKKATQSRTMSNTGIVVTYQRFTEFIQVLDPDERSGIAGLDVDIIDKLFRKQTQEDPKGTIGWNEHANLTKMRNTTVDGSWKQLFDPSKYAHALRPIFDPRLSWTGAPGWEGWKPSMGQPLWAQNSFRLFLNEIWHIVDEIQPPQDCLSGKQSNKSWKAFEKAGGFPTLVCIQAAKTLWVMLAYETNVFSGIKKTKGTSSQVLNDAIKNSPPFKKTKFWVMAPSAEAARLMSDITGANDLQLKYGHRKPIQLSRDLHDCLYISLLNDVTFFNLPSEYTVDVSSASHTNNSRFLQSLPRDMNEKEKRNVFYWRRLAMAGAMDKAIHDWVLEMTEGESLLASDEDDEGNEYDSDEDLNDFDDDEEGANDASAIANKWTEIFITHLTDDMIDVTTWHLDNGSKICNLPAIARRDTWAEQGRRKIGQTTVTNSSTIPDQHHYIRSRKSGFNRPYQPFSFLPIVQIPGVDWTPTQYNSQIAKCESQNPSIHDGLMSDLILEFYLRSRFFWIGGPNDILRPSEMWQLEHLPPSTQKGFQHPFIRRLF